MKRPHPTIALLLWLTAAYAAGYVGTLGTLRGMDALYPALRKPAWTPPAWIFAPVWTVLYALIGLAAWRVGRTDGPRRAALSFWWLGLGLNAAWPWLFFAQGRLGLAFAEIVVLWLAILATVVLSARRDRLAPWLLLPYLAWVGFAAILNLAIWRMN